jgi:hypothetical protein
MGPLLTVHVLAVSTGYLTVLATGVIGLCALLMSARLPLSEPERRDLRRLILRLAVFSCLCLALGIPLGMIWAKANLGRAWAWSPPEIGAAFVFLSALLLVIAVRRPLADRLRYLVAVIGGVTLAIGWGGANAVTPAVPIVYLCGAFAAAQITVLMLHSSARRRDPLVE